jgi:hypothetical protein
MWWRNMISPTLAISSLTQTVLTGLHWWLRELRSLLPKRWRERTRAQIEIRVEEGRSLISLVGVRNAGTTVLDGGVWSDNDLLARTRQFANDLPVLLFAPRGMVLSRLTRAPLSALSHFERLLALQFDQLTPYSWPDVLASWSARSTNATSTEIELRYIPASLLLKMAEPFVKLGLIPTSVVLDENGTAPISLQQHLPSRIRESRTRSRRIAFATLVAAIVGFVLCDWYVANKTASEWSARIETELKDLAFQKTLQQKVIKTSEAMTALSGKTPRTVFLTALAVATPPTDWYTEISFHDQAVVLRGYSAQPDRLMKNLEPLAAAGNITLQGEMGLDAKLDRQRFSFAFTALERP